MNNITSLIKKMLNVGLSSDERIELSQKKSVDKILTDQWEAKSDSHIKDKIDPNLLWKHITTACWGTTNLKVVKSTQKRVRAIRLTAAAAVAVILVSVWIVHLVTDSYITLTAPLTDKVVWLLPDSTKVWGNAGSTLRYKKNFIKNREVLLTGEAIFDVTRVSNSPFKVSFNGSNVEVKGTLFTIKSDAKEAEVVLFNGKIAFTPTKDLAAIDMKPSDRIVYDVVNNKFTLTHVDAVEYDWRHTEYRFVDKPLEELIEFLNRTYKKNIILTNTAYATSHFSGIIKKNETLEHALDKVCFTFDLDMEKTDNAIILH